MVLIEVDMFEALPPYFQVCWMCLFEILERLGEQTVYLVFVTEACVRGDLMKRNWLSTEVEEPEEFL